MARTAAGARPPKLHASQREEAIVRLIVSKGFVSFQDLDKAFSASPASLRRDLDRLQSKGKIIRVHGGARAAADADPALEGVPFKENVVKHAKAKGAIGLAAAKLCQPGEAIIIDGGSTTLQMCPHLGALGLQVLTNALNIVMALLPQPRTRISMPAGTLFREQNIVLSPDDEDGIAGFHASKLFIGAAAVGRHGPMQADTLLIQAERRFLKRAEQVILLVDSSKFHAPTGQLLCPLEDIDTLITDDKITDLQRQMIEKAAVKLIIASDP
jgi:DeoR family transcriptional regulator, ulaG and ulaABCDEF operon transcriptional repressor